MNRNMKHFFLSVIIFLSLSFKNFSLYGQNTETHYRIYSVKTQQETTLNDIIRELKSNDVLFFGEEHNDSIAHEIENKLLEMMYANFGKQTVLSLEMFERDVQPIMNEYIGGYIREKNFIKDARIWSNYKDYRPMIEFAKKNSLYVICANAPSRYTYLAGSKGQTLLATLPETSKPFFAPLPFDTATGEYRDKIIETTSQHTNNVIDSTKKMPPSMPANLFNFVVAQSLWDATMAYSLSEFSKQHKNKKILQINGKYHSDEYYGIVLHLKKYAPTLKILVISCCSDESFPNINWNKYKNHGDYIIITDPTIPKTYE